MKTEDSKSNERHEKNDQNPKSRQLNRDEIRKNFSFPSLIIQDRDDLKSSILSLIITSASRLYIILIVINNLQNSQNQNSHPEFLTLCLLNLEFLSHPTPAAKCPR